MHPETLDKINALTRRTFRAEELYTFPVTLCDNDIDRDGERFSDDALDKLAVLYIGRTGIFDHNPSAGNQSARIYDTEVITDPEKKTAWGGVYRYLKGYAYMVKTASNADLIKEIDAGIKKEVSVSCSASSRTCSVCGTDRSTGCEHTNGKTYGGNICHTILDGITDAYEWSFVAVPAQPDAGVTKQYTKGGTKMEQEFTPITTQKDFDTAVQQAVDTAVTAKAAEFEGWISPEDAAALHQQVTDLTAENQSMKMKSLRQKAAQDAGLAPELADRLVGETAEELASDAQALAAITNKGFATPHFEQPDRADALCGTDAALLDALD